MFTRNINFYLGDDVIEDTYYKITSSVKKNNDLWQIIPNDNKHNKLVTEGQLSKNMYVISNGIAMLRKKAQYETKTGLGYGVVDFFTNKPQNNVFVSFRSWTGNMPAV